MGKLFMRRQNEREPCHRLKARRFAAFTDTAPECVQYTPQFCVKDFMRQGPCFCVPVKLGGTTFITSHVSESLRGAFFIRLRARGVMILCEGQIKTGCFTVCRGALAIPPHCVRLIRTDHTVSINRITEFLRRYFYDRAET